MKKQLLTKLTKGVSVALLAGVMVCGAGLSANASSSKTNNSAAYEEKGIKKGQYNSHNLGVVAPKANKKAYRHYVAKHANFRHGAYYYKFWSNSEKFNKQKMNLDFKKAKFDQKKGYKKAEKNALYHAHKLNWWVHHDEYMLSLAK